MSEIQVLDHSEVQAEPNAEARDRVRGAMGEKVNHPAHYGGENNPFEAIKVIEAWDLGFCLGNTVKYIARAEHKGDPIEDLEKAAWYLDREIERRRNSNGGH